MPGEETPCSSGVLRGSFPPADSSAKPRIGHEETKPKPAAPKPSCLRNNLRWRVIVFPTVADSPPSCKPPNRHQRRPCRIGPWHSLLALIEIFGAVGVEAFQRKLESKLDKDSG